MARFGPPPHAIAVRRPFRLNNRDALRRRCEHRDAGRRGSALSRRAARCYGASLGRGSPCRPAAIELRATGTPNGTLDSIWCVSRMLEHSINLPRVSNESPPGCVARARGARGVFAVSSRRYGRRFGRPAPRDPLPADFDSPAAAAVWPRGRFARRNADRRQHPLHRFSGPRTLAQARRATLRAVGLSATWFAHSSGGGHLPSGAVDVAIWKSFPTLERRGAAAHSRDRSVERVGDAASPVRAARCLPLRDSGVTRQPWILAGGDVDRESAAGGVGERPWDALLPPAAESRRRSRPRRAPVRGT